MKKPIWIAWEDDASIRSKVLAKEFSTEYYAFTAFEGKSSLLRYPIAIFQTCLTILLHRPRVLFVQDPSVILAFLAAILRIIFRYQLIIDHHTHYINPKGLSGIIYHYLNSFALRHCDIIIVTNKDYRQELARQTDQEILLLPDKIPEIGGDAFPLEGKSNILYICSFSEDEPWEEVIESAKFLDSDQYIYLSGRHPEIESGRIPENVILTGFTSLDKYHSIMNSVDVIMVLTNQESCLVCGGYEAIAAEKPLILSDKKTLKEYFTEGTVFTNNNAAKIAEAIKVALSDKQSLREQIKVAKASKNQDWSIQQKKIIQRLR